jgi:hypothetical protein
MSYSAIETALENILSSQQEYFQIPGSENLPSRISTNEENVVKLLKDYKYPVSSWPVIIEPKEAKQLKKLTTTLPQLLQKIVSLKFDNDPAKVADFYFNGDQAMATYALMCHEKCVPLSSRLDLTLTDGGFKVLEANIGSSIGGWQVQSFESIISKMHPALTELPLALRFKSANVQKVYMKFLVDSILESQVDIDKEINIFFYIQKSQGNEIRKDSIQFFNGLLQEELSKRGLVGNAYSDDFDKLNLNNSGLFLGSVQLHGVLILNRDPETNVPPELFRAFITDHVHLQDHLGISLLSDKRNLALLRELAANDKFREEENELMLKSIPWTEALSRKNVTYNGEEYDLLELLRLYKDRMVIKAAKGKQGINVFIGKFLTSEQWEKAIEEGLGTSAYIVQEFSDSKSFIAPDGNNLWSPHKLIWGAFGFGDKYGGVWVRMSAVKTDRGVINSASGAVEAIVYEYEVE